MTLLPIGDAEAATRRLRRNTSHGQSGSGFLHARWIQRDTAFRDVATQLEQLTVDASCCPRRVLRDPAENQVAHFPAQGSPPGGAASPRQPRPVQPKSNAMPAHHRFWGDQQERFPPPGPQLSEPEHVVDGAQSPGEGNQFGISRFRVTLVPVRSASTGLPHRVLIPRNSPLPPLGDPRVHSRSSVRAAAGSARTFFSRVCNFDDIITS